MTGYNSGALLNEADKELARQWRKRLGLNSGDAQSLFHAEAHSLMRAFEKTGGNLPSEMTMYSDRVSCSFCQKNLPVLMREMNVDKLMLKFKDGSSMLLKAGE